MTDGPMSNEAAMEVWQDANDAYQRAVISELYAERANNTAVAGSRAAAEVIRTAVNAEVAKALDEAARLVERRMEQRFDEYGTREPDTNACYYSGRAGETYEALDEEDEAIAAAIRNLKGTDNG